MKALVLEREAIRRNAAVIKEKAGAAAIYAVLTGDAHGAGLLEMAKLLREEGIGRFAVSEPSDAAALRKAGFVDEEILMLRSTTDREELEQLEQAGIRVPYSCRAGICGCCRIRLVDGEVSALKKSAIGNDGTILCCSCVPKTSVQLEA